MAKYTIELRDVVETHNIFPFRYPFYDENKRPEFEEKFIKHFYFREIGTLSIDQFIFFLEDKMKTIFPYYNKLFEAAEIEYSILDNYKMSESTTIKRETIDKSKGGNYSVGQAFDDQQTSTTDSRTTNTESNGNQVDTRTQAETGTSETITTGKETDHGSHSESVSTSETHSESSEKNSEQSVSKKFLDTPQGLTNLSDTKYLTTLNLDNVDGNETLSLSGNKEGSSETEGENSAEKNTTGNSETDTSRDMTENGSTTNTNTGKEETEGKTEGSFKGEHKTTLDSNTRNESIGNFTEVMEHSRVGNIGIDTDSDMIHKHIKLQQILTKIEMMFFDECEDLFMMVY